MSKFSLKKYFFLIAACALFGCQQYHRMEMGGHLVKPVETSSTSLAAQPKDEGSKETLLKGKFVVLYLHGLNMDASESDLLAEALEREYGEQVINIQSKCREGSISMRLSIDQQAKKVFEELKTTLRDRYPESAQEVLQALPINIFGFSQGGLLASIFADNYKDVLNIKTVILAHAPLSGTDLFENTRSGIREFHEKAQPGLDAIGHPQTSLLEVKALSTALNTPGLKQVTNFIFEGIKDMRIGSKCTERIATFIRKGNHNIPILVIAGYLSNLSEYLDFEEDDKDQVDAFAKAYAKLTTGQEHGEHDILIALRRQLCRTNSFESLATSKKNDSDGPKPHYPNNVEIHIVEEIIHCYNLTSILSYFQVNHGKLIIEDEKTISHIANFISKHN